MDKGLPKFVRFAENVWNIRPEGKSDREIAEAGLEALRNWMREIGLPLTITEIGATPDMIDNIVSTTVIYPAGYLDLKPEDIKAILQESL
jgi:alcohol dehydrogenase YqhD (iron-dependent ADH family)